MIHPLHRTFMQRISRVKVNGELKTDPVIFLNPRTELTVRVGKRIKKVVLIR